MRSVLCSLLFAVTLLAQSAEEKIAIANLTSTLIGIGKTDASRTNLSQRLAGDMLALVDRDREPSSALITAFAEEFTATLYGKALTTRSVDLLQQSIRDMLRGTAATFASAASLRQILSMAGVDPEASQLVTRRFMKIGEEVRGPDDLPLGRSPNSAPK